MFARLSAFVIWSLVAATAVFWALRLGARSAPVPAYAAPVANSVPVRGDLSRLFGAPARVAVAAAAAPEAPSRFRLIGVMAPRSREAQAEAGHGLALIAVDGKPPKAYAVGARLDSDLVLQSVGLRTASIGPAQGARSVLLELPPPAPPNSGVLPPVAGAMPVPPVRAPAAPLPGAPTVGPAALAPAQPPITAPPTPQIEPSPQDRAGFPAASPGSLTN
jgi:general secretion pathway protein C